MEREPDTPSDWVAICAFVAIVCALLLLTAGCGGGGGGGQPARQQVPLPDFISFSTDLPRASLGTAVDPLHFASPLCPMQPAVAWQQAMCASSPPAVWPFSNHFTTELGPHRWRVVINNEDAWDPRCNTGPPAQSLPVYSDTANYNPSAVAAHLTVYLANEQDNCRKIPYVGMAWLRGVQDDLLSRAAPWGSAPELRYNVAIERTVNPKFAQSLHLYLHFRSGAQRYMVFASHWDSGYMPQSFAINWNWPIVDSYYYPGAKIAGGARDCGINRLPDAGGEVVVDVEAMALCRFPDFAVLRPDFLGFEVAAEATYLDFVHPTGQANLMRAKITNPVLTVKAP